MYQVQRGDTLTVIARHFHTTVGAITERNQLEDPDNLAEGQTLTIPPASSVRLQVATCSAIRSPGFELTLSGGQPGEPVIFAIDAPDGSTYTGSPHVTGADGDVTTTYDRRASAPASTSGSSRGTRRPGQPRSTELRFHVERRRTSP